MKNEVIEYKTINQILKELINFGISLNRLSKILEISKGTLSKIYNEQRTNVRYITYLKTKIVYDFCLKNKKAPLKIEYDALQDCLQFNLFYLEDE